MGWYALLVGAVGVERLAELRLSVRHARWSVANGGVEFGRGHYPLMVALHIGLLGGCLAEVALLDRPFIPALGWPALAVVLAAQGLRWWCIASLGPQWNTRVIVVPGMPLVARGPYRWRRLPHPNYLAVVVVQAAALANERAALSIQSRRLTATVQLVKALGGGFEASALAQSQR